MSWSLPWGNQPLISTASFTSAPVAFRFPSPLRQTILISGLELCKRIDSNCICFAWEIVAHTLAAMSYPCISPLAFRMTVFISQISLIGRVNTVTRYKFSSILGILCSSPQVDCLALLSLLFIRNIALPLNLFSCLLSLVRIPFQ